MKATLGFGAILVISAVTIGWAGSDQPTAGSIQKTLTSPTAIHQEIDFAATPARVYNALLDAKQFGAFSSGSAEIQLEAGGAFTCFDGRISGRNVELVPNRRIVQAWRSNGWPEGIYSIVRFEFKEEGSGTRLVMDQTGFPDGEKDSLESGWKSHYWEPLRKYLGR
jgi:activator of HSP90 ATPase